MTDIQRRRVSSLLAFQSDDAYVSSLFHSWVDPATHKIVFGKAVQANPWEWGDSIEPQVDHSVPSSRPELKNSSSIPLEVFGTRPTGERVIIIGESADAMAARQLEDGLAGDNMFERDWRETRKVETAEVGGGGGMGGRGGPGVSDHGAPASRGSSPAQTSRSTLHPRAESVLSTSSRERKRKASPTPLDVRPARGRGKARGVGGRGKGRKK